MKAVACFVFLLASAAIAQLPPIPTSGHPYDAAFETMKQRNAAEKKAAEGNADLKAWDYVFADKKAGVVTVLACGSVIKPTDPVEFFVATADSGKDYESLTVTLAKPSDIKAAMEFIGLKPGLPIDPEKNSYWPRGQRVIMTFNIGGKAVRAEDLVLDTNAKKPLPQSGLVFTGSYEHKDEQGDTRLAADVLDAKPIAPLYNDPAALIDVPRQAVQSVVYGFQKPSPAWRVKTGEIAEVTCSAAAGSEAVEEWYITCQAAVVDGKTRIAMNAFPDLFGQRPMLVPTAADDLLHLIARIADLADGKRDFFTTVSVDSQVPINDVRNLYAVLQTVEKDRGVKLDSLLPNELFHRSFFPKPEWRDRATRLAEPWELFLARDAGGKLVAKLERATANPERGAMPKQIVESTTPADPAAFVKTVNDNASRWSKAIFVYPPPDLTYGELMTWVRPVLATYPRVFVFPAVDGTTATTQPATQQDRQPAQPTQPAH